MYSPRTYSQPFATHLPCTPHVLLTYYNLSTYRVAGRGDQGARRAKTGVGAHLLTLSLALALALALPLPLTLPLPIPYPYP